MVVGELRQWHCGSGESVLAPVPEETAPLDLAKTELVGLPSIPNGNLFLERSLTELVGRSIFLQTGAVLPLSYCLDFSAFLFLLWRLY